jgi:hypothetical protein
MLEATMNSLTGRAGKAVAQAKRHLSNTSLATQRWERQLLGKNITCIETANF